MSSKRGPPTADTAYDPVSQFQTLEEQAKKLSSQVFETPEDQTLDEKLAQRSVFAFAGLKEASRHAFILRLSIAQPLRRVP